MLHRGCSGFCYTKLKQGRESLHLALLCSVCTAALAFLHLLRKLGGRWPASGALGAGSRSPQPAPLLGGCACNWSTFELVWQITPWHRGTESPGIRDFTRILANLTKPENFLFAPFRSLLYLGKISIKKFLMIMMAAIIILMKIMVIFIMMVTKITKRHTGSTTAQ